MAFNFPNSPTLGQEINSGVDILFTWNGYAWVWGNVNVSLPLMAKTAPKEDVRGTDRQD